MATVTSVGSGNYNTGSTWDSGARPGSGDDVVIANGHDVTVVQAENANSLEVESGGTLTVSGGTHKITIDGENGSGYAVDLDGDIVESGGGKLQIQIDTAATTLIDIVPTSGNVHHLRLNHASCICTFLGNTSISGNLNLTAGELKSAGANSLTVAGVVTNNGTLTFNGSTVNLGSTSAEAGDFEGSGTFNLDTSTINFHTAGSANFTPSTSANFDTNTSTLNLIGLDSSTRAHNFTFASGNLHNVTTSRGAGSGTHIDKLNGNCTITGDLTVGANSKFSSGTRVFTVNGDVSVTGELDCDDSDKPMTFGSLTIASGGTYLATSGTTTITDAYSSPFALNNSGTFTHNSGTLKLTRSGNQDFLGTWTGSSALYNLTIDCGGGSQQIRANMEIEGGLIITNGNFSTHTDNHDLTVVDLITVNGGTFTTNSSTINCGGIRNVGGTIA